MIKFTTAFSIFVLFLAFGVNASLAQSGDTTRRPPVLRGTSPPPTGRSDITSVQTTQFNNSIPTLVTVPTTVMDRNGRYIANLRKEDFTIFDNGVEQKVAYFASIEKPFTVALMLDVSGSTKYQMEQICQAAETFISRLRPNDRLLPVAFDGRVNLLSEVADVSTIRQSTLRIPAATDGTVLYDSVDLVLKKLAGIEGRKAIVLMTDGVDQSSKLATLQSTLQASVEQDVIVYTIQYNTQPQLRQRLSFIKSEKARRKVEERLLKGYAVSEPYLRGLADKTGGRFYKADDLRDVAPAFAAITAELGVQYSLGYYPKENSPGSGERAIKVRVRYPNLVVRARESYATSPIIARQ